MKGGDPFRCKDSVCKWAPLVMGHGTHVYGPVAHRKEGSRRRKGTSDVSHGGRTEGFSESIDNPESEIVGVFNPDLFGVTP